MKGMLVEDLVDVAPALLEGCGKESLGARVPKNGGKRVPRGGGALCSCYEVPVVRFFKSRRREDTLSMSCLEILPTLFASYRYGGSEDGVH